MIGAETNLEIDGSSGGAVDGLKPRGPSATAVDPIPGIFVEAGTAGCPPEGGGADIAATGAVGAATGAEFGAGAGCGGGDAGGGADAGAGAGGALPSSLLSLGGGDAGGGVLEATVAGNGVADGGAGGGAAASVPARSASPL